MNGRGLKVSNDYARAFGRMYDEIPKAVFAAVAASLCFKDVEEKSFDAAVAYFVNEWRILNENGIVSQYPSVAMILHAEAHLPRTPEVRQD